MESVVFALLGTTSAYIATPSDTALKDALIQYVSHAVRASFASPMSDSDTPQVQFEKIWQKVPQEERKALLVRAQAKAIEVCVMVAIFGCTAALGLALPWILLGVAALLPVLFQVVVARMWLEIKPQTCARYFAANSAALKYAEAFRVSNPTPKTVFRGSLQPIQEPDADIDPEFAAEYAEEAAVAPLLPKEVWICLFSDALLMFSETPGGTKLEFIHSILDDFSASLETPEDIEGNPLPSRLLLEIQGQDQAYSKWLVTSPHPSCLATCDRKIRFLVQRAQAKEESAPTTSRKSHSLFASRQLGATLDTVSH